VPMGRFCQLVCVGVCECGVLLRSARGTVDIIHGNL